MHETIVTAPGSLGDVNPMLAIARVLQSQGREVIFLAAERYLHLAQRAGLKTHALFDEQQFSHFVSDPDLWHPRRGVRKIFENAVNSVLRTHYQWLEEHCTPGQTLLVSHLLDLSGRIYRDKHPNTRLVSVIPAPVPLRSFTAPPRLSAHFWERWFPKAGLPLAYWAADHWLDRLAGSEINDLRRSLQLPPVRRMLKSWWWSPDKVLCLFPEWFSIPNADLLPQMRLVGFPLADSADVVADAVQLELQEILQQLDGAKPIVFAPGTANDHGRKYLSHAAEACRQLRLPAILLSNDPSQLPQHLPPRVFTAKYLPFSQLLSYSAAIVHHGGVGTTSQAFAAGIPQIVLPMAFDQFDNAERVQRLRCGSWLPMRKLNTRRMIQHLQNLPSASGGVASVQRQVIDEPDFADRIRTELLGP
jgi:rhamnosyltransferase subunit B